jgi:hypothetical protein
MSDNYDDENSIPRLLDEDFVWFLCRGGTASDTLNKSKDAAILVNELKSYINKKVSEAKEGINADEA